MKLIQALTDELKAAAQDFVRGEIDLESFRLRMDLIADQVASIDLNFNSRLQKQKHRYMQLLNKTKHAALAALHELKFAAGASRKSFNFKIRRLLESKIHFKSLYWTIRNNLFMYEQRDPVEEYGGFHLYAPIFIQKEYSDNYRMELTKI